MNDFNQGKLDHPTTCPKCETALEAFTAVEAETTPKPGDITVCWDCGELLVVSDAMELIQPDKDTVERLLRHPALQRLLRDPALQRIVAIRKLILRLSAVMTQSQP